jgi:hypothetical protein
MPAPKCSDQEFIATWRRFKSGPSVAKALGVAESNVCRRRRAIERRYGIELETQDHHRRAAFETHFEPATKNRVEEDVKSGVVIVFSDAHYWPGVVTTAHKALVRLAKTLQPKLIIANGDVFDGAGISRHPPHGWEKLPSPLEELNAVKDRLGEIERAAGRAKLYRTRGNHDLRFERHLAMSVPEFRGMQGFKLFDHLPAWPESWSIFINGHTVVKHRYHNGVHAAYNNALKAGASIVTGHLHSLKVTPWTDYNGTRYGVDTGTLADPNGPQFEYGEDNPANHRSGFAVLTFNGGRLLPPELCEVSHGTAWFRGEKVA